MKKFSNKIIAGLMAATMVLGMTACGSSTKSESDTTTATSSTAGTTETTASKGGQTLKVLLSEEPGAEDALNIALQKWATETGNKIETIIISNDDIATKFPSMAKNKDLPDLMASIGMHQLYPDEFVDVSTFLDTSMFSENALKIVGKDFNSDEITGAPLQYTTTCMYYNQDAFTKAGITAPTVENPWTWDELYANAATLQQNGGTKYGFAADVSRARYDILMYANGGSMVQKNGDAFDITINSAQNAATLQKFIDANESGVMPKAIWAGGTTDNPVEYFKNGDAAILLSGSWNYNTMSTEITKFKFGVMPSPSGSAGQAAIIGGSALAVPKNAKNSALAEEFLKWLYTPENFQTFLQSDKGLSVLNDVVYKPADEKATADFATIQNEVNYVSDLFMVDESSSWRTYKDSEYRDYIKKAVAGELTAQKALDSFATELSQSSGWVIAGQ